MPHCLCSKSGLRFAATRAWNYGLKSAVDAVFPAYAKVKGNENATTTAASYLSQTLMKHIRAVTEDGKVVVHSLRHRLLDKLRDAGASEAQRDPFAGHSSKSTGDRVYGSVEARVRELNLWVQRADP